MTSLVCHLRVVKRSATEWRSLLQLLSRQEILHGLIDLFILLHEWPVSGGGDVGHTQARDVLLGQLRHFLLKGKVLLAPDEMGRYLGGNDTAYDFYEFFMDYASIDVRAERIFAHTTADQLTCHEQVFCRFSSSRIWMAAKKRHRIWIMM